MSYKADHRPEHTLQHFGWIYSAAFWKIMGYLLSKDLVGPPLVPLRVNELLTWIKKTKLLFWWMSYGAKDIERDYSPLILWLWCACTRKCMESCGFYNCKQGTRPIQTNKEAQNNCKYHLPLLLIIKNKCIADEEIYIFLTHSLCWYILRNKTCSLFMSNNLELYWPVLFQYMIWYTLSNGLFFYQVVGLDI